MPLRAKARRSRLGARKLATRADTRRARSAHVGEMKETPVTNTAIADVLARVAQCAEASVVGLGVLARHARDEALVKLASDLAEEMRGVASTSRFVAGTLGVDLGGPARASTCERLRWEWLASTGALLDGGPSARLRAECLQILERTRVAAARLFEEPAASATAASNVAEQLERRLRSAVARLEAAEVDALELRARAFATT